MPIRMGAPRQSCGTESVADLVVAIGFYFGVVRLLVTLDIELEPEYQPYIERFPLMET